MVREVLVLMSALSRRRGKCRVGGRFVWGKLWGDDKWPMGLATRRWGYPIWAEQGGTTQQPFRDPGQFDAVNRDSTEVAEVSRGPGNRMASTAGGMPTWVLRAASLHTAAATITTTITTTAEAARRDVLRRWIRSAPEPLAVNRQARKEARC